MKTVPAFCRALLAVALMAISSHIACAEVESTLNIGTPAILLLKNSMANRFTKLRMYLEAGVVGLTEEGGVAVRNAATVDVKTLLTLDKLIVAENKDRATLYREIARANNHAEWEFDLRAVFCKRWISRMPAGWFYRNDKGLWIRKGPQ